MGLVAVILISVLFGVLLYCYDYEHIVVEGTLKDDLLIPIYVSGKGSISGLF